MKKGTLIKTYKGQRISSNSVKYDTLLMFYRDENGEKKTIFVDRPVVDYYVLKDKDSEEAVKPPLYIELDKVDHYSTYSDNLYRDIAVNTGALSFYDRVKVNYGVNSYNMNNLLKSPLLYNADVDLEDQYIAKFYREYEPDQSYKLHKCYFDIENDIYHFIGFPEPKDAPCPVCLITLIDEKEMKSHTFILRNQKNIGLTELEADIENFKLYMANIVKTTDNLDMTFEFYFYDDEIILIQSFFNKVHEIDPDFCSGWNIEYDIQTLQNRLKRLYDGIRNKPCSSSQQAQNDICDDKYLIQHNDSGKELFINPYARYTEGQGKIGQRTDTFTVLDGINWLDQMWTYGSVHLSQGKLDSYKLDFVANYELKKEKLPFGPGETIRNQLYKNPRRFVEYNIRDVILLLLIERKTLDIETVQQLSDITVTRKEKVFKKSIALTNFVNKYAYEQNLVMRTNKNVSYGNESKFYETQYLPDNTLIESDSDYIKMFETLDKYGAYVSNPELNDHAGMELFNNKPSKYLWELVCDMDFSSLYPSIIRAFNLDTANIIGKFYCKDSEVKRKLKDEYECKDMFLLSIKDESNAEDDVSSSDSSDDDDSESVEDLVETSNETEDLCSVLTDTIISQDWNMLGHVFMDLPTTEDLINIIEKR